MSFLLASGEALVRCLRLSANKKGITYMTITYMTTSLLKSHRVSPSPSLPLSGDVSSLLSTSVLAGKPAPHPPFCRVPPESPSCREPLVCEPFSSRSGDERIKARQRVVRDVAFVQPERELIDVSKEMLGTRVMVDAMQPALQDSPNALDRVCMSGSALILARAVVDGLVPVKQPVQIVEEHMLIGIELRPNFDVAVNLIVDVIEGPNLCDLGERAATFATFAHPEYSDLADAPTASMEFLGLVLVPFFSPDEAFIKFDNPAQFVERSIGSAASFAEPSEDEPGGFLGHSNFFCELHK
jgi:hypothetical protein